QGAPTVANWRLNLIALSQTDNLLFVAYGDKVHVIVPLNVRQTIPSQPDLILRLPRSRLGQQTTGYIDPYHPHCVNHLMVGKLGDFEILLLCCDDGDVMAYYTRSIAAEIQRTEKVREALPRQKIMVSHNQPFFHENVGISAWGLAIHQRGRLIAISSNKKEVTVFAFALHESPIPHNMPLSSKETFPLLNLRTAKPHDGRNQNYKRILRLHRMGHNIPSIAFADDAHGVAKYVLAMDILGTLWQLNIWDLDDINYEPYRSQSESRADRPMGWGVLVLPVSLFKRTKTPAEALGMPLSEEPYGCGSLTDLNVPFDISDSVHDVRRSSQWHPMFGPTVRLPEISEAEQREATATTALVLQEDSSDEDTKSSNNNRIHKRSSKKFSDLAIMEIDPDDSEYYMPDGSAIMRIFQNHIDLQPPTKHMHHTVCKKLLKQRIPEDVLFQLQHIDRLSIHAVIEELNLVVVASQVGRVALLTLTRPEDSWSTNGPVTLFRVDMFLPFRKQEDEGLRPVVPLLGMTVGPMQSKDMIHKDEEASSSVPGSRRVTGLGVDSRRRWRLILHYYDHTVLTYEISRKEDALIVL
ncbi:CRT10-domain-containing protein, partial [Xylogone sp. PMI_703]